MGAASSPIMMLVVATALAVALFGSAPAAAEILQWYDGLCRDTIRFDPGKYQEERLRNTVHLLFGPRDFNAPFVSPPMYPQHIALLDVERTNQECRNALEAANRIRFVPLKGIEDYRRAVIAEIEDTCKFETVMIRGLQDSSALREYQPAEACWRFVDALEGKSNILTVFRETLEQNCSNNASPAQCVERQLSNAQKADGAEWVRLYVFTFGWYACANTYALRSIERKKLEQLSIEPERQFRRLFKVTKDKCDAAPDSHPEFGTIATLDADVAPAHPEWNILNLGLFCGSAKIHPGRIVAYVYGLDYQRLQTGQPVAATLDIDGKATELMLQPYSDMALTPVHARHIRDLLQARAASIRIKDGKFPNPDRLKLDGAGPKILSALKKCYKS